MKLVVTKKSAYMILYADYMLAKNRCTDTGYGITKMSYKQRLRYG